MTKAPTTYRLATTAAVRGSHYGGHYQSAAAANQFKTKNHSVQQLHSPVDRQQ